MSISLNAVSICEYFHNRRKAAHLKHEIQTIAAHMKQMKDNYKQQMAHDPQHAILKAKATAAENAATLAYAQLKEVEAADHQFMKMLSDPNLEFDVLYIKQGEQLREKKVCLDNVLSTHQNKYSSVQELQEYCARKVEVLWSELQPFEDERKGHDNRLEELEKNMETMNRSVKRCAKKITAAALVAVSATAAYYLVPWRS